MKGSGYGIGINILLGLVGDFQGDWVFGLVGLEATKHYRPDHLHDRGYGNGDHANTGDQEVGFAAFRWTPMDMQWSIGVHRTSICGPCANHSMELKSSRRLLQPILVPRRHSLREVLGFYSSTRL